MQDKVHDIFTEPGDVDPHTLRNLGPLTRMAGIFEGRRGLDIKPTARGAGRQTFLDRIELQPIDPQTNGPQLFYGLRYHQHVVKPGSIETYHDQVGYWLWEPATGTVIHSLTIPRGLTTLAAGQATVRARSFELVARRGSPTYGICANPFLDESFETLEFRIRVTIEDDGWSYDEDTIMRIRGQEKLFHHRDQCKLTKIGEPTPNPLAQKQGA